MPRARKSSDERSVDSSQCQESTSSEEPPTKVSSRVSKNIERRHTRRIVKNSESDRPVKHRSRKYVRPRDGSVTRFVASMDAILTGIIIVFHISEYIYTYQISYSTLFILCLTIFHAVLLLCVFAIAEAPRISENVKTCAKAVASLLFVELIPFTLVVVYYGGAAMNCTEDTVRHDYCAVIKGYAAIALHPHNTLMQTRVLFTYAAGLWLFKFIMSVSVSGVLCILSQN